MSSVRGRTAEDFSVSPSTANVQLRTQLLVLSRPWKNVTSNKLESEFLRPKYYRDQGVFETKVLSGPMRVWDRSTTVTRAGSWPTSFGWDGYGNRHSFKSLKEAKWKWANIWSSWQRAPATVSNCFARLDNVRHSDEMRRDQLQVKSMRPRVLSDPVSRPNCTESSGARQLKSFHISRRGKLICHDASGFTVRPVIDRSPLRGRAASASSCELGERGRRRRVSSARLHERSRPTTPSSQDPAVRNQHSGPPSLTSTTFYRVMIVGSSGVGKSTVMTQFLQEEYTGDVADTSPGLKCAKFVFISTT